MESAHRPESNARNKWEGSAAGHPPPPRPPRSLSRRCFLRQTALGSAGLVAGPQLLRAGLARAGTRASKIVRASHAQATSGLATVNQGPVDQMVHAAVRELTGQAETGAAWKSLFPAIDVGTRVGIKINLACGDVPTHPEVVNAIVDGLRMMDLGGEQLPEESIIVWDLDNPFFCAQTGYTINYGGPGVQYYGTTHPAVGHDTSLTYSIQHGASSYTYHHPSKILSQQIDYLINAAVIKDHDNYAGVTLCLKNHYGSFDGISDTLTHYANIHYSIPRTNQMVRDDLGRQTVLCLIDGTLGLCDGGPGYIPPYHTAPNWAYNSVLVGCDPVAIDRIGTIKINEERATRSLAAIDPGHVTTAAQPPYNLGTDDPLDINLVEIDLSAQHVPDETLGSRGIALLSPYPNPAPGPATLRFHTARALEAQVVIVDATGSLVRRIAQGRFSQGLHRFGWDGRDDRGRRVPAGTYFCRLGAGGLRQQERLVIVH